MFKEYSNEQLLELIQNGNKKAFDVFFLKQYPVLCAYASQYVNIEDGQEIAQDVMLWLWENHEELAIEKSIDSYLFQSVKYKCFTMISRHTMKQRVMNTLREQTSDMFESPNFYILQELSQKLESAIEQLPESYKKAFILHRFNNRTYKEIAEQLNVSPKTVDYRIQQALKILRVELKEYLPLLLALSIL